METIVVDDFNRVDLLALKIPMIVIYERPRDYPEWYVARLWDTNKPTPYVIIKKSLYEIRVAIPLHFTRLQRDLRDDPAIKEIYI